MFLIFKNNRIVFFLFLLVSRFGMMIFLQNKKKKWQKHKIIIQYEYRLLSFCGTLTYISLYILHYKYLYKYAKSMLL